MAGRKLFVNNSGQDLQVTLFIRMSENPANNAGTKPFHLGRSQSTWVDYGDDQNIYLNGISIVSVYQGQIQARQEFVITRGSDLDNQFNMNNCVSFGFANGGFTIATSQV